MTTTQSPRTSLIHSLTQPVTIFNFVEIHLSTLLLVFFALLYKFAFVLAVTYFIVVMHELAHVVTAMRCGIRPEKIVILPFGVTMKLNICNIKNPAHEIIIAVAGPLSNIIMAYIALQLFRHGYINFDFTRFFVTANCGVAIINIIPALPLDGGRILRAFLTGQWGYVKAFNTVMVITKICAVVLAVCGIAILLTTHFNFSVLIIASFLIVNAVSEQRGSKMVMMKEILYSRQKLTESGIEKTGVICIMRDAPARKILKHLTYNKYYIINIIDDDMNVIASVTETKLIESLITKGIRVKADEIIDLSPNTAKWKN